MAWERYSRQILLKKVGEEGQRKLSKGSVCVVGAGALGSVNVSTLARAGVGSIRVIDRDILELNNLHRQLVYDENDVGKAKASALAEKLKLVNSEIKIESVVDDVTPTNVEQFIKGVGVVVDGTDNLQTRYLVNDACIKHNIPWIYGGAIATYGMTLTVVPGKTPCLRCVFPTMPPPGALPTCETVGILNTIPHIIASMQSTQCLKILLGKKPTNGLLVYDGWELDFKKVKVERDRCCSCCEKHKFEFLSAEKKEIVTLGGGKVQINPFRKGKINLKELSTNLSKIGEVELGDVFFRFTVEPYRLTIFNNGRTIVHNTDDEKVAKSLYSRYVGI